MPPPRLLPRDPDIISNRDVTIDLGGGVIVDFIGVGPARTTGEVVVFVEPDRLPHGKTSGGTENGSVCNGPTPPLTQVPGAGRDWGLGQRLSLWPRG